MEHQIYGAIRHRYYALREIEKSGTQDAAEATGRTARVANQLQAAPKADTLCF